MLIDHCSPTLAGLKTASLVRVRYEDPAQMTEDLRCVNRLLRCKGIRVIPLRFRNGYAQLYIYRPKRLFADISEYPASEVLRSLGYDVRLAERCVAQLAARMNSGKDFPHEIGFFLADLQGEGVTCQEAPDGEALESCKALGACLAR